MAIHELAARLEQARAELYRLGVEIVIVPGEYRVNYRAGTDATAFATEDLDAAIAKGHEMAAEPQGKPLAPLGPMGKGKSRKGEMYKHNRKLAARRAKKDRSKK